MCEAVSLHVSFAEAKVDKFDVSLSVQHHVLRLKVAVHDVQTVQVLQGQHDFLNVDRSNHYFCCIY